MAYVPPDQRAQLSAQKDEQKKQMWGNVLKGAVMGSYLDDKVAKPLLGVGLTAYLISQFLNRGKDKEANAAYGALLNKNGNAPTQITGAAVVGNAPANYINDQANLAIAQQMAGWNGAPTQAAQQGVQNAQDALAADNYYSPWLNQNQNALGGLGQFAQPQTNGGILSGVLGQYAPNANAATDAVTAAANAAATATPQQLATFDEFMKKPTISFGR